MRSHDIARDTAQLHCPAETLQGILGSKYALDLCSDVVAVSGSQVSSITDLTGRGNSPSQSTGSKRPTTQAGMLDGHASVRSDGGDDVMRVSGTLTGFVAGDRPFYYTVLDPRSASATYTQDFIYYDTDGAATSVSRTQELLHNTTNLQFRPNTSAGCSVLNSDLGPQLWVVRYLPDNTVRLDVNNVEVASAASTGLQLTALWLSLFDRLPAPSVPSACDFYRHLVVNPAPNASQHRDVLTFLKRTYPSLAFTP